MQNKLKEIAQLIYDHVKNNPYNIGLLSGSTGEVLFLYYYSLVNPDYKPKAEEALEELVDSISNNPHYFHTYCSGFAGFGIALHLLEEKGFIEGSDELLEDIDVYLQHQLTTEIALSHYDFLHGVIGLGFYFLKHAEYRKEFSITQLERIVDFLEKDRIVDTEKNTIKWKAPNLYKHIKKPSPHADFNISLSHGISSIVIFLSRLIETQLIDNEKIRLMLDQAVNYILAQRIDEKEYGCYFPSSSLESSEVITKSRMAWCYGDLGVAVALWRAGNVLNRKEVSDLALGVLHYSAQRKDMKSTYVMDAGLCHGTSGIAQIFFRMHQETNIPEFYSAYEYWRETTLKYAYHEDGLAGYKYYKGENEWTNEHEVLEGIAGIGLSMLSPTDSDWDEILLLSFK